MLQERLSRGCFIDHAPVTGLLRADLVGKQRGPHRLGRPDLTRQPVGAACIRDQANARKGLNEIRIFGRNHHIRRQCKVRPCPGCRSVDRRNCRHTAIKDRLEHRHIFIAQSAFQIERCRVATVTQILPRTERLARPRQHDNPRILFRSLHRMGDLGAHLRVQRVHHIGAVQRDHRNRITNDKSDGLIVHARNPF